MGQRALDPRLAYKLGVPPSLLTPLVCSSCRGATPLVEADETRCPYCDKTVHIPSQYRKLAEAQRTFERHAARVGLWNALGRAPAWPYRLAAWYFPGAADVFLPFLFSPFLGGVLYFVFISLLDGFTFTNMAEVYDWFPWMALPFVFGMAFMWLTAFMGVVGKRRALALGALQLAATARAPEREGGQCTCRRCGAPLAYGRRDLGVRCAYCETDNLLHIPEGWVRQMKGRVAALTREFTSLEAEWAVQREDLAHHRRRVVMVLSVLTAFFSAMVFLQERGAHRREWPWRRMRDERVAIVYGQAVTTRGRSVVLEPRPLPSSWSLIQAQTHDLFCSARTGFCRVYLELAVVRDERWLVSCTAPGGEIEVGYAADDVPMANGSRWTGTNELRLARGACENFGFTAASTGLYRLTFTLPGAEVGRTVGITLVDAGAQPRP